MTRSNTVRMGLVAAMAASLLLIILMALLKPNGKPVPESHETALPVTVIQVTLTNMADLVYLPAVVEAHVDALLAAEKAGRIVELAADRGDHVQAGQLLMRIDDRIWQANLSQATIAAENARRNHERFQVLQKSGAVAESEYDNIEKAYIQADALATEARINIEQCRVVSPIGGIVNNRLVEAGEYVQPGTPVFQVVDAATVRIVIQIPERDIFAVHAGDRMSFTIQPLPGQRFEGTVTFVATQADPRNNAFRTEITVNNDGGILRPGMIAQIEFHRGNFQDMVALPMSAVLPSKGDHIVFLAKDGRAIRRKIQLESLARKQALVSRGLETGDLVIVEGNRNLRDGQRVEIQEAERGE